MVLLNFTTGLDVISFAKAHTDYDAYVIDITPEMAKQIIERASIGNRKENKDTIGRLVKCIKNDMYDYRVPQSGISFNEDGMLTNGHHQLIAISMCEKTVRVTMLVGTRNHEHADSGKSRSIKDHIIMSGAENADSLQNFRALIKNVLRHKGNLSITNSGAQGNVMLYEIIDFYNKNAQILNEIFDGFNRTLSHYSTPNQKATTKRCSIFEPGVIGAITYVYIDETLPSLNLTQVDKTDVINFAGAIRIDNLTLDEGRGSIIDKFRIEAGRHGRKGTKERGGWTFEEFRIKFEKTIKRHLQFIDGQRRLEKENQKTAV